MANTESNLIPNRSDSSKYQFKPLATTKAASIHSGLSCYELRRGAKEGRYPVIILGTPDKQFRKLRWNLDALDAAILKEMNSNAGDNTFSQGR